MKKVKIIKRFSYKSRNNVLIFFKLILYYPPEGIVTDWLQAADNKQYPPTVDERVV